MEAREAFCKEKFPCPDPEDGCVILPCNVIKSTSGYPACPPGMSCKQVGFIKNEETGETTYMTKVCRLREDCGCDADPSSDYFTPY